MDGDRATMGKYQVPQWARIRICRRRGIESEQIYDIVAPLPDETGRAFVDLACTTGASQG